MKDLSNSIPFQEHITIYVQNQDMYVQYQVKYLCLI